MVEYKSFCGSTAHNRLCLIPPERTTKEAALFHSKAAAIRRGLRHLFVRESQAQSNERKHTLQREPRRGQKIGPIHQCQIVWFEPTENIRAVSVVSFCVNVLQKTTTEPRDVVVLSLRCSFNSRNRASFTKKKTNTKSLFYPRTNTKRESNKYPAIHTQTTAAVAAAADSIRRDFIGNGNFVAP